MPDLPSASPRPVWNPSASALAETNLGRLMRRIGASTVAEAHAWSVTRRAEFWATTAEALNVRFSHPYERVLDESSGPAHARWFVGGRLNIAACCLDRPPEDVAIVTRRADGRLESVTVGELASLARRAAAGFRASGVGVGDGVGFVAPMTVEVVAAYLGVLLIGGYAVSVPESLPAEEIRARLVLGRAKLVLTQDRVHRAGKSIPLYERVVQADAPPTVVIAAAGVEVLRPQDREWAGFLAQDDSVEPVQCAPDDLINVLFSSGTTGEPKAVPWEQATPIKAAGDAHWHQDVRPGDVLCWPTSMGWMMGPWVIFSGLLNRATIALYEGGPVERGFCQFVQDAKVTVLGVVPSMVRAWRRGGLAEGLDWSSIRLFSSTGEASDPDDYAYLMNLGGPPGETRPVLEYCGGSELAGGYIGSTLLVPNEPSVFNGPTMGTEFVVLDAFRRECPPGAVGEVFLVPPAVGMTTRLLNRDNDAVYYDGCPTHSGRILRRHGDLMMVLGESRYRSFGRADDTMNLGGIKTSSAEIEQALAGAEGVSEVAAVGIPPLLGGPDRLVLFAVSERPPAELLPTFQSAIRHRLNPLFHVADLVIVSELPRTPSNKLLRRFLRDVYREREASREPS